MNTSTDGMTGATVTQVKEKVSVMRALNLTTAAVVVGVSLGMFSSLFAAGLMSVNRIIQPVPITPVVQITAPNSSATVSDNFDVTVAVNPSAIFQLIREVKTDIDPTLRPTEPTRLGYIFNLSVDDQIVYRKKILSDTTVTAPITFNNFQEGQHSITAKLLTDDGKTFTDRIFVNFYTPVCGNNVLDQGEQCDDGNTINGDGCSATCNLESVVTVSNSTASIESNITIGSDQLISMYDFDVTNGPVAINEATFDVGYIRAIPVDGGWIGNAVQSFTLINENGSVLAGPVDVTSTNNSVTFSDAFVLENGIHRIAVRASLRADGQWSNNDTIYTSIANPAKVLSGANNSAEENVYFEPDYLVLSDAKVVRLATLEVERNAVPADHTVVANSSNHLIGSWNFDATASGEDIRLTALDIHGVSAGKLANFVLKDGEVVVGQEDNPAGPVTDGDVVMSVEFTSPVVVERGTTKTLKLYADVPSSAQPGEVDRWGLLYDEDVTAYGQNTGNTAEVSITGDPGAVITVGGTGHLTIDLANTTPPAQLVVAGTTMVNVGEFKLTAGHEGVDITEFYIQVYDGGLIGTASGNYEDIGRVYLKDGSGNFIGNSNGYNVSLQSNLIQLNRGDLHIPEGDDNSVTVTIFADIAEIGINEPGTPNADIKIRAFNPGGDPSTGIIKAYGVESNSLLPFSSITVNNSYANPFVIHKAVPVVTINNVLSNLSATVLHEVDIVAFGGDIGLYSFAYQTSGNTVVNGSLHLASCTGCPGVTTGRISDVQQTGNEWIYNAPYLGWSFTPQPQLLGNNKAFLILSEGARARIQFRANPLLTSGNNYVRTSFMSSAGLLGAGPTGSGAQAQDAFYFQWSDLHASEFNDQESLDEYQWYGGYLVPGLGTVATTPPVTVYE